MHHYHERAVAFKMGDPPASFWRDPTEGWNFDAVSMVLCIMLAAAIVPADSADVSPLAHLAEKSAEEPWTQKILIT